MSQRILVVDDDKQIVRLVRSYLEQAGYQVLTAYDGETALQMVRRERPDLVVLDLMLPDRDGWDITRQVRADPTLAPTPILMLTARVEDVDRILGLELGADDYVAKPFNTREVVARVRAILRRSGPTAPASTLLRVGPLSLDAERHRVALSGVEIEVTPTEFNLLKLFMEHPGHVLTRQDLVERGLGYDYGGMDRTIDSHIKNLRKKVEPDPTNPTLIQTVHGVGYRLAEQGGV